MNALDLGNLGRQAFDRRAWSSSYLHLSGADKTSTLDADLLERLAISAFLTGRDQESLEIWTRSHHAYLREGNALCAVRCAFWLGFLLLYRNEFAQSSGWLERARRLLDDVVSAEQGYLLFTDALRRHWGGDPAGARGMFEESARIGVRFQEADLVSLSRLGLGDSMVQIGEVTGGMALLDEVMAAVTAGELSTLTVGVIYCAVIGCCRRSFDIRRAREWTTAFSQWCESQPELVPFRGECLVQRAEIMRLQGAWPRAMEEVMRACDSYSPDNFVPWAGEAFYQQGELHRLRGEYPEAEEAYRQANQLGYALQPGLALLRLAQGRLEAACATITRLLAEAPDGLSRAKVLPAYVEIMLAADENDAAEASMRELTELASRHKIPFLGALATQATGSVLLARQQAAASLPHLRKALAAWHDFNAPYEAARVRVQIGVACRALGDTENGDAELRAAREIFYGLGAKPELSRIQTLLDGRSTSLGGLTEREVVVLRLVAAGKSNRAIAEQLVLSEHTVRRHVQNIFAKLGVSSRAAATAFAVHHDLV